MFSIECLIFIDSPLINFPQSLQTLAFVQSSNQPSHKTTPPGPQKALLRLLKIKLRSAD